MRAGVVTVRHVLLALCEMTAGTLEHQLVLVPLVVLHHLGEGQRLVGEGLPDGRHELRVLGQSGEGRPTAAAHPPLQAEILSSLQFHHKL